MDDRIRNLERQVRLLRRHVVVMLIVIAASSLAAFRQSTGTKFIELDVERINIVEKNGTKRLAIANSSRSPPITFR